MRDGRSAAARRAAARVSTVDCVAQYQHTHKHKYRHTHTYTVSLQEHKHGVGARRLDGSCSVLAGMAILASHPPAHVGDEDAPMDGRLRREWDVPNTYAYTYTRPARMGRSIEQLVGVAGRGRGKVRDKARR